MFITKGGLLGFLASYSASGSHAGLNWRREMQRLSEMAAGMQRLAYKATDAELDWAH